MAATGNWPLKIIKNVSKSVESTDVELKLVVVVAESPEFHPLNLEMFPSGVAGGAQSHGIGSNPDSGSSEAAPQKLPSSSRSRVEPEKPSLGPKQDQNLQFLTHQTRNQTGLNQSY